MCSINPISGFDPNGVADEPISWREAVIEGAGDRIVFFGDPLDAGPAFNRGQRDQMIEKDPTRTMTTRFR